MRGKFLAKIILLHALMMVDGLEAADRSGELLALARQEFVILSASDRVLFQAAASGRPAVYSSQSPAECDPADAQSWSESRVLAADRIVWLCTDPVASKRLTHRGIWVVGARIEGDLDLALARVDCPLFFVDCAIPGEINLSNAELRDLHLPGTHTGSIQASGLLVNRNVVLNGGFEANGQVDFSGAQIGGNLDCDEGRFIHPGEVALLADELRVDGDLFMQYGFESQGEVSLRSARIRGDLKCGGGVFTNTGPDALHAAGIQIGGDAFLRYGFQARGRVSLTGATIGGNLDCDGGEFTNPEWHALEAKRLQVTGEVTLTGDFLARGVVNFDRAKIGGSFRCEDSQLLNPEGRALSADGLKVAGDVVLRQGLEIAGEASFDGAKIDGTFYWSEIASPDNVILDLRSAKIGRLWDDRQSWPQSGNLLLNGLVYDEISGSAPSDAASRIVWLRRQPTDHFRPQPYEQLAFVLQKSGRAADAEEVLIAKEEDRYSELKWSERWLHRLLGIAIGYGFRPWRALWLGGVVVVLGAVVFGMGARAGLLTATKEIEHVSDVDGHLRLSRDYPKYNALVYSLDMFVPLLDLHQAGYWLPSATRGRAIIQSRWYNLSSGGLLRLYLGLHIYAGWALTTLLAVGLSGLVHS